MCLFFRHFSTKFDGNLHNFHKMSNFCRKKGEKVVEKSKIGFILCYFFRKNLVFFWDFHGASAGGLRSVGSGDPTALACDPLTAHLCGSAVDSSLCNSAISTHKSALYKSLGRRLCELFEKIDTLKLRITSVIH